MRITTFTRQLVYIVGGSTGIGLETGKIIAKSGGNLVIFARNEEKLRSAIQSFDMLKKDSQQQFSYHVLDVSKYDDVRKMMEKCVVDHGVPTLLINCAGRALPHKFDEISYTQLDDTMKINFYGIWNVCSCLVPYMKQNGGYIVNTASMAGFMGIFGYTDYSASKFAIMGFSEALRSELKSSNIGVSVLCPPDTNTPGFQTENLTKPKETQAISAGTKIMTAEQVARGLLNGIMKQQSVIIPSFDGKMTYFLKRIWPSLVEYYMDKTIAKSKKN